MKYLCLYGRDFSKLISNDIDSETVKSQFVVVFLTVEERHLAIEQKILAKKTENLNIKHNRLNQCK